MIKFLNIRNKEVRVAETEPQISALWASSDHSPNVTQGQDFGWRLAPEVVVEMKKIKQDYSLLLEISKQFLKSVDELNEPDILTYISMTNKRLQGAVAQDEDYTDEYNEEIRRLEIPVETETTDTATTTATTTESLADMEKRAEFEERIANAKQAQVAAENTTTTTTVKPITTTTTTKKQQGILEVSS